MFDEYLGDRSARLGGRFQPFTLEGDYKRYVDGKPRLEGVASFLESRGIALPEGSIKDPPERETLYGLANRKNDLFLARIRRDGIRTYPSSIDWIRQVKAHGLKVAVVSSSRNCSEILEAAGIKDLFDAQVDGIVASEWWLEGKPAPDTYLEAARRLAVEPGRAVVIEDAISGVQAGKAGHFGFVVGVDRDSQPALLRRSGADVVVADVGALTLEASLQTATTAMPPALERIGEIGRRIGDRKVAVFLDYDGTLTPIVARPDLAVLSDTMRSRLRTLAKTCTVVVVSGRERANVEDLVGLSEVVYAGCHGFDILGPQGTEIRHEEGDSYIPEIQKAGAEIKRQLASVEGVLVEVKTYALAVHFRLVAPDHIDRVEEVVDRAITQHPSLRKTGGKKIFELRPDIDWDKGKAVLWLLEALDLGGPDVLPIYLGDDLTDFDAFDALRGRGLSFLVAEKPQSCAADYLLASPEDAGLFLSRLTAILGGNPEDG